MFSAALIADVETLGDKKGVRRQPGPPRRCALLPPANGALVAAKAARGELARLLQQRVDRLGVGHAVPA